MREEKDMRVVNFGSLNIDYVYRVDHFVQPGETMSAQSLQIQCGGKGLNQSIAAARAGGTVSHAGKIGGDGTVLTDILRESGVDTDFVTVGDGPSGHAVIQVDPSGQNCNLLFGGCNQEITHEEIDRATVIHEKHIYKEYIGLDACAANLMRPAMYGAYHHITVLGKENEPCDHKYDVVGGLCENNDKFAVDRMLPKIDIGDILYIHDTGAHGSAMGYNYNGKLHCAEVLLCEDGSHRLIRRAQTPRDYFATLDFLPFMKPLFED